MQLGRVHDAHLFLPALLTTALLLAAPAAAAAEPHRVVEELFASEIAYPQERYELQGQIGWSRIESPSMVTSAVPLSVEFGITDQWQLGVEVPFAGARARAGAAGGVGNIEVEALYNFLFDQRRSLLLTAVVAGQFPSASERAGDPGGNVELTFAALKGIGHLYLNATLVGLLDIEDEGRDVQAGGRASAALMVEAGSVVPVLEIVGSVVDGSPEVLFASGIRWHPGARFELGLGAWLATDGARTSHGLMSGCVWELELDGDDD